VNGEGEDGRTGTEGEEKIERGMITCIYDVGTWQSW